jgi:hypothetical protein
MELSKKFIDKWKVKDFVFNDNMKCNIVNNVPDGKYEHIDNIKLICSGEYKMGVRMGEWIWKRNDKILAHRYYSVEDDNYIEKVITYHDNGKIHNKREYLNDILYGFGIVNYNSGNISIKFNKNYTECYYNFVNKNKQGLSLQKIYI